MKNVLAVLNRETTAQAVLAVTRLVAARVAAEGITVMHPRLTQDPSFMPTEEVMTDGRLRHFDRSSGELAAALRQAFHAWQASCSEGKCARWVEVIGDAAKSVGAEATQADLIVVGHVLQDDQEDARKALRAALYDAAAPVIVAPIQPPRTVGEHVAVAWEPSRAVEEAIRAALPLLTEAGQVTIMIGREGGREPTSQPSALIQTLDQETVPHEVVPFNLGGRDIGEALLAEAKKAGADLLVMGAYTHNRLVEAILGGATQELLAHADIALLMHH